MFKKKISNEKTIEELVAAGRKARSFGFVAEAIQHYQSVLESNVLSLDDEALIRCQLSEALEKAGLYREEIETIRKYDKVKTVGRLSPQTQTAVLIRLGWAFSFNNDIPRAVAFFNQVLHTVLPDDLKSRATCHAGLGRSYRVFTEIQFARDHYTTALEYYRRIGDLSGLAESYINLASVDMREGDHLEAVALIKQAFALLADSKDSHLLASAYQYLALVSYYLDDLSDNMMIFEGQMENIRKTGAVGIHGAAANNYAFNLTARGEWDKAENLALEAIDLLTRTSNVALIASGMDTLASIYLLRGDVDRADNLLKESIRLTESIASGEWSETISRTTLGRCCLTKGESELAIGHFERAIEICERMGNYQHRRSAQVWLAEALLQAGKSAEAIIVTESLRSDLRESPDIDAWGYLARVISKLEFGRGHIAGALQLLNQSSSVFEIRGAIYDRAVNRVLMAQILERSGKLSDACAEVELARADFESLGAKIDRDRAVEYLKVLNDQRVTLFSPQSPMDIRESNPSIDLVSILDGFMTERILDASISRKLLLHELASISREQAQSNSAIVIEIDQANVHKIVASVGFENGEEQQALSLIAGLGTDDYQKHFVYSFTDHHESNFLLQIINPTGERFLKEKVNFRPLLYAVEYGLQKQLLKTKARKRTVFEPIRVLADAEMEGFICKSQSMTKVIEQIYKIRSSKAAVLITGESGTGKELVARAIHMASARQFTTFLPFNCSSVARDMVESQLFGFRKGSFTGASANSEGVIRAAEHGTLFLDEIGEMPIDLQPKLLRFLQEGEIHPLGESKPIKVDVRLVAATNVDLETEVAKGRFREDLFYRLNVIRVHVPPLRERREEIPVLIAYYLKQYQQEEGKTDIALSQEAIDLMIVYDWPGNVRQLCNELRRLIAYNESGTTLNVDSLSSEIVGPGQVWFSKPEKSKTEADLSLVDSKQTLAEATDDLERSMIQAALRRSSGNIAQAAKELGLSRGGLYLKMNRLKLQA